MEKVKGRYAVSGVTGKAKGEANGAAEAQAGPFDGRAIAQAFAATRLLAKQRKVPHRNVILEMYGPGTTMRSLLIEKLELECTDPTHALVKQPVDKEVKDFREGFDLNRIARDLGHTPNAMAGALVDSAKSKRDAAAIETNGRKRESNGAKSESKTPPRETKAPNCDPSELFERTQCFLLPLSSLVPTPENARKTFDPAKLESLAADMKKSGQSDPCLVRPAGSGQYMLVDGERRFRAAKIARLSSLRCEIKDLTDEEARERGLVRNLQREDLNPIERAIGYKQLLDDGRTQDGVAKLLGLSGQPVVSNAVRLLELPEELQAEVAAARVNVTLATAVIPYARVPGFSAAFLKVGKTAGHDIDVRDRGEIARHLMHVFREFCAEVGDRVYNKAQANLAEKHADELGVIEFKTPWKTTVLFIRDKTRWNALSAKLKAQVDAREDRRDARDSAKAKKLTPAQAKERAKELEEQNRRRVNRWYVAWLQARIVENLADRASFDQETLNRLMLHFAIRGSGTAREELEECLRHAGEKAAGRQEGYATFAALDHKGIVEVGFGLLSRWLAVPTDKYQARVNEWDVRDIAREMSIDVGKEWTLTEAFLELFTKDGLFELGKESGWALGRKYNPFAIAAFQKLKRSEAIAQILEDAKDHKLPTPAILLALAKAKGD